MDDQLTKFLIFIAIALGSAFVNWLSKRGKRDFDQESPPLPPKRPAQQARVPPAPRSAAPSLQEQVRRILEERVRQAAPPARPSTSGRKAAPPPVPPVIRKPQKTSTVTARVEAEERGLAVHLQGLRESSRVYEQAKGLDRKVGAQLEEVKRRIGAHPVMKVAGKTSAETAYMGSLLKNRRTLRSMVLASVILGPPGGREAGT